MHNLNSFHRQLKYDSGYFGGKANKRVDKLISVLLKFEQNMFIRWKQKLFLWKRNKVIVTEVECHTKGMKINKSDVKVSELANSARM